MKHSIDKEKFISSGILLEMAKEEYTKERERANSLDNKASFFMTVIVAISTIFVPIIPFSRIYSVYLTGSCFQKCCSSVLILGLLSTFTISIIAFQKLYNAYKLTDYMRPNLDVINGKQFHINRTDVVEKGLCDHYKTVVDDNIMVNNKKCIFINEGIRLSVISFLLLIISTIGLIITIGG